MPKPEKVFISAVLLPCLFSTLPDYNINASFVAS